MQTVLITGAGRGIGRATALRFAARGDNVVLVSRTLAELEQTADAVRKAGGTPLAVQADVTSEADMKRLAASARQRFGRVDVLVNNAGLAPLSPLPEMTTAAFDALLAVNLRGVFLACREVWPLMTAAGGGTIVNISSRAARDPFPGFAAYGGTKAFVETFTKALAGEGVPVGIKVFAVAPGAVDTKMLRDAFPDFPRERCLAPDDVAGLIEWLTDPRCAACSGQTFAIARDGA